MQYIKGMTWGWVGRRGTWKTERGKQSMRLMVETLNVDWTAITFGALQETAQSTEIEYNQEPVVTDDEIRWAIREAKSLGLKVCLKPTVNCKNGTWRAHISFFDQDVPGEPTWGDWFDAYTAFMVHYARIAEETGCEMLCIGCEMVQSNKRENEWRALIREVRRVYSGIVTYNCDKYQEERIHWWDAVDVISSSGYYPLHSWEDHVKRIEHVVRKWNKPFFFMEAGCPSRIGSSEVPNDWEHEGAPDMEEQDRYYREMFAHIGHKPWFYGFMLWDWQADLYDRSEASENDDYAVYGKKAEETIRTFYNSK